MKQDILDINGKMVNSIELPKEIFGLDSNDVLLSQVIAAYQANNRQGKASTKTRGEVQGSTRKLYRQKGTGRARAGSVRSPIRVGGGIVFGPKPRDFKKVIPKKIKKKALFIALSEKVRQKKLLIVEGLERIRAKTKEALKVLKACNGDILKKVKILLVTTNDSPKTLNLAVRNISFVNKQNLDTLNAYSVVNHTNIIFTKETIEKFLEREITKVKKAKKDKSL